MEIRIEMKEGVKPSICSSFARYLSRRLQRDISREVRRKSKNYKVREEFILTTPLIKWTSRPPKSIDLISYFDNCVEVKRLRGAYVIQINPRPLVKGSKTTVKYLIRVLEYGTQKLPALPVVRKIFSYYSRNYLKMFNDYLKESL